MADRRLLPEFHTLNDVQAQIDVIRRHVDGGDDEAAASEERQLHAGVLAAIAQGECEDAHRLAGLALSTTRLVFRR